MANHFVVLARTVPADIGHVAPVERNDLTAGSELRIGPDHGAVPAPKAGR
jgi:hypothetical protein